MLRPKVYYNEFDPGAAAWLRELIKEGHIADGEVDTRSILDVSADDLRGFTQCHFFAGIGGWSHALRLAGWADDRPVWTGSPPCQPFSAAGRQEGRNDARHLAPHFISLVGSGRPRVLFGEQVASAEVFGKAAGGAGKRAGNPPAWAWIDDLCDRLEAARYAVGASDFPSAGVGAPHIRQRTFFGAVAAEWMADRQSERRDGRQDPARARGGAGAETDGASVGLVDGQRAGLEGHGGHGDGGREPGWNDANAAGSATPAGADGGLADCDRNGLQARPFAEFHNAEHHAEPCRSDSGMADAEGSRRADGAQIHGRSASLHGAASEIERTGDRMPSGDPQSTRPLHGFWADADWLFCRDGKWRPVEPSVQRVADGVPVELVRSGAYVPASSPLAPSQKGIDRNAPGARRVMRLRGYGNAINPHAAAQFIRAFDEALRGADEVDQPVGANTSASMFEDLLG